MSFNLDISQCKFQRPPVNSDISKIKILEYIFKKKKPNVTSPQILCTQNLPKQRCFDVILLHQNDAVF